MIPYYSKEQVIDILTKNKEKARQEFESIQYVENKKKNRLKPEELENTLPKIKPKEEIFEEMKQHFKNSWKSPGQLNREFSNVPVLKACALTSWQIDRISLAERSYKCPKGDKGLKIRTHGTEFPAPGKDELPQKFQDYLDDFSLKYEEFRFRPSKYGKLPIDERTEKFTNRKKEPFRLTNSKQANEFGFDKHSTWETEINTLTQASRNKLQALTLGKTAKI